MARADQNTMDIASLVDRSCLAHLSCRALFFFFYRVWRRARDGHVIRESLWGERNDLIPTSAKFSDQKSGASNFRTRHTSSQRGASCMSLQPVRVRVGGKKGREATTSLTLELLIPAQRSDCKCVIHIWEATREILAREQNRLDSGDFSWKVRGRNTPGPARDIFRLELLLRQGTRRRAGLGYRVLAHTRT